MESFWYFIYNTLGLPLLYALFSFGALINPKIRNGINGRRNLFRELEDKMVLLFDKKPRFWIHNSSMGEFEQAKPLIEKLKERFPDGIVIVSFFSPSGLEHVKEYQKADYLCYIPFDSSSMAKRFISLIKPDVGIVVRHDFWPNHLKELNRQNIPAVLINCSIRHQYYFRFLPLLKANRIIFSCFNVILAVSYETKMICEKFYLGKGRIEVAGDTRYDQVVRRAKEAEKVAAPLRKIKGKRRGFVMGSTWPSDEVVLFDALSKLYIKGVKVWLVVVPHEPTKERVIEIEQKTSELGLRSYRLSDIESERSAVDCDILIVDRVGILASLYTLGDVTFVGGGFGPGVHNVLEPAALGKAVLYGPRCNNSYEAGQLKKHGVGFIVRNGNEIYDIIFSMFKNSNYLIDIGKKAEKLVRENMGATERIVDCLEKLVI